MEVAKGKKIHLVFYLGGKKMAPREIEQMRLKCLMDFYNIGFEVIRLYFKIDSTALEFSQEWDALQKMTESKSQSHAKCIVSIRKSVGDVNLELVEAFLKQFGDLESQIIIKDVDIRNLNFIKVDVCQLRVVEKVQTRVTYVVTKSGLLIQSELSDIVDILLSIQCMKHIRKLQIFAYKDGTYFPLNEKHTLRVLQVVDDILPLYQSISDVTINQKPIQELNSTGKQIYETHLRKRNHHFLSYMVGNKSQGKYNSGKIIFVGDFESGKSSILSNLLGDKNDLRNEDSKKIAVRKTESFILGNNEWQRIQESKSKSSFSRDLNFVSAGIVQEQLDDILQDMQSDGWTAKVDVEKYSLTNAYESALQEGHVTGKDKEVTKVPEKSIVSRLEEMENQLRVNIWDFCGYRIFDALQTLYLTDGAIILIVFDLEKFVKDLEVEAIKLRRWLSSIALYSTHGKTLLIGTRAGSLDNEDIQRVDEILEDILADYYMIQLITDIRRNKWFFPIDNSVGEEDETYVAPIKRILKNLIDIEEYEGTWNKKVDISWIFFMAHIHNREENVFSYSFLEQQALEFGLTSQDTREMIDFFSSAGALLDYSRVIENDEAMSVVLHPNWLVDILGRLVLAMNGQDIKDIARQKHDGSRLYYKILKETGIMASTLIDNLFAVSGVNEREREFIYSLCQKKFIMAQLMQLPVSLKIPRKLLTKSGYWVIPSFFSRETRGDELTLIEKAVRENKGEEVVIQSKRVQWAEIVPISLFENFVCALIKQGAEKKSFLMKNLNTNFLLAELNRISFEVCKVSDYAFFLNIYSTEATVIEEITNLVESAYIEICASVEEEISNEVVFEDVVNKTQE